ncbi:MAG: hypothetical protein AB7T63_01915 [Planctomycetota bacterium]
MKPLVVLAGVLFVGLAIYIGYMLSQPYLPARHIDPEGSRLVRVDTNTSRLVLRVLHVGLEATIDVEVEPALEGPWSVNVLARPRKPDEPEHDGTVTVERQLPAVDAVLVFDRRWAHPKEHPEGLRLDATAAGA